MFTQAQHRQRGFRVSMIMAGPGGQAGLDLQIHYIIIVTVAKMMMTHMIDGLATIGRPQSKCTELQVLWLRLGAAKLTMGNDFCSRNQLWFRRSVMKIILFQLSTQIENSPFWTLRS